MGTEWPSEQDRVRGKLNTHTHITLYKPQMLIRSKLFRFTDRKEGRYLLGPTHEEEITTLVARSVKSYKSLPLRLYQISK